MNNLNPEKLNLIDLAFSSEPKPKSFADLGGIWNVGGAYALYTIAKHKPDFGFLVDVNFTPDVIELYSKLDNLEIICDDFRCLDVAKKVDKVEVIFLFDVLLHQAKPDWAELLKLYARRTNYFLIYNPQWIDGNKSVRLLDLGEYEYFKNVPHTPDHPSYRNLKTKKDSTDIWQWGITDYDLVEVLRGIGFKQSYYKNCGRFGQLENFESHAFIFRKID